MRKSSWSFASVSFKAISVLMVNKLFAIFFGTTGITILAHFQNLIGIVTALPNDGVNRGVIKYWSSRSQTAPEKHHLFYSALFLNLITFLAVILLLFLNDQLFFNEFIFSMDARIFYLSFFGLVFLFIINLLFQSLILAEQNVKAYALINITSSLVIVVLVWQGVNSGRPDVALLSFITGQVLTIFFTLGYAIRYGLLFFRYVRIPKAVLGRLGNFMLMALAVLIFRKLTDFLVRDYAITELGFTLTGLWQSVVKVSDSYIMLFAGTVGVIFYPKISSILEKKKELSKYVRSVLGVVIPVTLIGLMVIYILRDFILTILFSTEFIEAGFLFKFYLLGDFFLFISYLLLYIIMAQARTITYISLQAISAFIYIGFIGFLVDNHGIEAFPMAYAIRYFLFCLILVILNRKILFNV